MKNIVRRFKNRFRSFVRKDIILPAKCNIVGSFFEGKNRVGEGSFIVESSIGRGTYVGRDCHFSHVAIGRYCSIGKNVSVLVGRHPTKEWVSTHPAFFSTEKQAGFTYVSERLFDEKVFCNVENKTYVEIGNDVWIGDNVNILGGVCVGDGAILGANALVTKDVNPYSIVAGIPARIIGERFDKEYSEILLNFRWWDKEEEWIKQHAKYFSDIKEFAKAIDIKGDYE